MAILDLRSEEPISEPTDEILPDETPPGLEAIRAWIRKPRPWLHGVKLWIRQFAKWWRAFRKWAATNAVPAARRATELAAGGAKAARGLAGAAGIAAEAAKHMADMGREWRNGDSRSGRIAGAIATRAGQFRDFSIRAAHTAKGAAAIGDAVSRFREMLPRRKGLDVGPAPEHDDSGPARRLVPVVPRPIPKTPPEPHRPLRNPFQRPLRNPLSSEDPSGTRSGYPFRNPFRRPLRHPFQRLRKLRGNRPPSLPRLSRNRSRRIRARYPSRRPIQ